MSQYINKTTLLGEIDRRIENYVKQREDMLNVQCHTLADDASAKIGELNCIKDFVNTLEIKELDLDALGVLAEHLIACDAHLVTPKYTDKELNLLEEWAKNNKTTQKGE